MVRVPPCAKKPARTASPIIRQLFDRIDDAGVPGRELQRRSGVHHVTLSKWKHGTNAPRLTDFEAVAQAMGFSVVLVPLD